MFKQCESVAWLVMVGLVRRKNSQKLLSKNFEIAQQRDIAGSRVTKKKIAIILQSKTPGDRQRKDNHSPSVYPNHA
jgi:hypothetical protein